MRRRIATPVSASKVPAGPSCSPGKSRSRRSWLFKRCIADQEGSAIVETALVMSFILIPLLLGIFSVCMALFTYQRVGYATFAAAQIVGTSRGIISDPCAQVVTSVKTVLGSGYPPNNFTYEMWITQKNTDGTTTTVHFNPVTGNGFSCNGMSSGQGGYVLNQAQFEPVVVQISYAYNWFGLVSRGITGTLKLRQAVLVS
ncbi:MAG: TadE family protein [Terracidiphilus sp.]